MEDRYIPRQVREITSLYPWQESVIEIINKKNKNINIILDKKGLTGKSVFSTYLDVHKISKRIPTASNKILNIIKQLGKNNSYVFDCCNIKSKEYFENLYRQISLVREKYKIEIWIFTSKSSGLELLDNFNYKLYKINDKKELVTL